MGRIKWRALALFPNHPPDRPLRFSTHTDKLHDGNVRRSVETGLIEAPNAKDLKLDVIDTQLKRKTLRLSEDCANNRLAQPAVTPPRSEDDNCKYSSNIHILKHLPRNGEAVEQQLAVEAIRPALRKLKISLIVKHWHDVPNAWFDEQSDRILCAQGRLSRVQLCSLRMAIHRRHRVDDAHRQLLADLRGGDHESRRKPRWKQTPKGCDNLNWSSQDG